jgi:ubiquinone/menaquinone biosynthesis C-methylase UbiE
LTWCSRFLASFHDRVLSKVAIGHRCRLGDNRASVRPFRYLLDPLCLSACLLYAVNRWLIAPLCAWPFLHEHFNDLLLIPAALPPILGLQRWIGLRKRNAPPTLAEIFSHLFIWSLISELVGPLVFAGPVADVLDVVAYSAGALVAGVWWNRKSLVSRAAGAWQPARPARFDRLARHYEWMELLLAGCKLERCRNAFWNEIPSPQSALLVGEGHGKFLASLLERNPGARVTCVDASANMLEVARNRLLRGTLPLQRVEFIQAELPAWKPPAGCYDLVATHFFLDCFPRDQLAAVIDNLQRAARPGSCWLISDFHIPGSGLRRLRARAIHRLMYAFFRLVTKLPASSLVPPQPFLRRSGFVRVRRVEFDRGLLCAELWRR